MDWRRATGTSEADDCRGKVVSNSWSLSKLRYKNNCCEHFRISLYRHNSCVIKLSSPFRHHSTAQSALKGNVISFMQNMPNIVTSLPLSVDELCDTLKIIFVGAHIPKREQLRKVCGVSRQKVRNALMWLKKHNHLYHAIPRKIAHRVHRGDFSFSHLYVHS